MQNKIFGLLFAIFAISVVPHAYAEDDLLDDSFIMEENDDFDFVDDAISDADVDVSDKDVSEQNNISAAAVANYDVNGSLFQQITNLEQEKVLMELEKERAQLDLDLDRLAAEKIKLQMEMDTLSGRAEQEQQILQNEKSKLEAEAAKIEQEKRALAAAAASGELDEAYKQEAKKKSTAKKSVKTIDVDEDNIASMYKLVNVMGAGNQLQATLSDLETGQTKRVSVGKTVNGFVVKSISLEDGVVFSKDGETQNLNISSR